MGFLGTLCTCILALWVYDWLRFRRAMAPIKVKKQKKGQSMKH